MSDRYNAIIVVLEKDIRSDDAESTLAAIRMIRGVSSVTGNIVDLGSHIAEQRARSDLSKRLFEVIYPKSN